MPEQPTIFVVDDDSTHREALSQRLSAMGFSAKFFSTADEYWNSFDPQAPGCVILDIHAFAAGKPLQELLAKEPLSPPVIVFSATADFLHVVRAMRQGASDFLQKRSYSELDLWEALHRALAQDDEKRETHARKAEIKRKIGLLSFAEIQVLQRLLLGKNNREIAGHYGISPAAVEARRVRIMKKLGVTNLVALVNLAIEADIESIFRETDT